MSYLNHFGNFEMKTPEEEMMDILIIWNHTTHLNTQVTHLNTQVTHFNTQVTHLSNQYTHTHPYTHEDTMDQ